MDENGKITSTFLGVEDHGIFTIMLTIQGEDWGQGYGGYALSGKGKFTSLKVVKEILDVFEVNSWEELKGKYCRVRRNDAFGKIIEIGNLIKNKWFSFDEFFAENK